MNSEKCPKCHKKDCGIYKSCLLHDDKCGSYKRADPAIHGVFTIDQFNEETGKHFSYLKLKDTKGHSEIDLIESRLGRKLEDDSQLCAHHRYTSGVGWKQSKTCQHPLHEKTSKQRKAPSTRTAPLDVVNYVMEKYNKPFPVGGVLCFPHLKEKKKKSVEDEETHKLDDHDHEKYVPDEVVVTEEEASSSRQTASNIVSCLESSPVVVLKRKRVQQLSDRTKENYKRKYEKLKKCLKEKFAEAVAPGQHEEFMNSILNDSAEESDNEDDIPNELKNLLEKYENSDAMGKLVILSLINHSCYTHDYIQNVFGCTKYHLDKAITLSKFNLKIPEKVIFTRNRMNIAKCEHFLEFMFSNGLIQDVAYGCSKLKFDSGEVQEIPKAILTCKYSHAIGIYLDMCEKTGFEAVSESTLWRILKNIKPSQQTSLAGLDDIFAAAMNAFELLKDVSKRLLTESDVLVKGLETGKRYLKTKYQSHCSNQSNVKTHNINFALSDPNDVRLQAPVENVDEETCSDCLDLWKAVNEVHNLAKTSTPVTLYDVNNAIVDIKSYVSHLIRDVQQKKAKSHAFEQLNSSTMFWLKDYSQKIIPMKFREGQVDYFGKKGISLHVDILFTKKDGQLKKFVYFTCMQRGDQDSKDVLSIGENILKKIHQEHPEITRIFTKSDNAGCYHNSLSPEVLYKLCEQNGISLMRYDFNEPCKGKDQCDRESSAGKTILKSYLQAGHDVMTADDIFQAMHYGYGMKDTEICVAENDNTKTELSGAKAKNFTSYHSIQFSTTGMQVWRYFNVGVGIPIPFVKAHFVSTGFTTNTDFSKTEQMKRTYSNVKRSDRILRNLFFCETSGCSQVFEDKNVYEAHCLEDKHDVIQEKSSMDKVKKSYMSLMKMSSPNAMIDIDTEDNSLNMSMDMACAQYPIMDTFGMQGWALPTRSFFRYSANQKKILYKLFMQGERNNKKLTPEQVQQEIRKKLPIEEFVTSKQVKSLYSRWAKLLKQGILNVLEEENGNNEMDGNEDGGKDDDDNATEFNEFVRDQAMSVFNSFDDKTDDSNKESNSKRSSKVLKKRKEESQKPEKKVKKNRLNANEHSKYDDDIARSQNLLDDQKGKYFCAYYDQGRYWGRLEKVFSHDKETVADEVEMKFLCYSCGYWDFPKKGDDANNKIIDAKYIFMGPCTPAETTKNGYKFAEDQKAILVYNMIKSRQ